jgi:hypothetical protein
MVKPGYRFRDGYQVPTRPTTIPAIMQTPTFALGVADARAGRAFHPDTDLWHPNDCWAYERGRAWAVLTPANVKFKRGGKITNEAIKWFMQHHNDIL